MDWIQGVKWSPTGFLLETIDVKGVGRIRPISELQGVIATDGPKKRVRGQVRFSDLRRLNQDEVASLSSDLGITSSRAAQAFYALVLDGEEVVMPAATMICAMFRPFHGICRYLFAPQGLDSLCIPQGNIPNPELLFFRCPRAATGMQPNKAQGILNSLSWMYCFPSARRMTCSVLKHAMQGRLDLELPIGDLEFCGYAGLLPSGRRLILELRIRLLKTSEQPFDAFSRHGQVIEFERYLHKLEQWVKPHNLKDESVPLRAGTWRLTDEEWQGVQDLVVKQQRDSFAKNARSMMDCLLHKTSQGLSWSDVTADPIRRDRCGRLLRRMQADGRWDEVLRRLRSLRQPDEIEVCSTPPDDLFDRRATLSLLERERDLFLDESGLLHGKTSPIRDG